MGKTKKIAARFEDGTIVFVFKDDACGADGKFDPGANQIGLTIDGMARASLKLSVHFFRLLEAAGVRTHFLQEVAGVTDPDSQLKMYLPLNAHAAYCEKLGIEPSDSVSGMVCKQLTMIPIEFIGRDTAAGSFCRMYGAPEGIPLHGLIEATLKSDKLGDPRINREAAAVLGHLTYPQYDECDGMTRLIGKVLQKELAKHGYTLIDFKVEFGIGTDGQIYLADEISGGIWRIKDKDGNSVDPVECAKVICK